MHTLLRRAAVGELPRITQSEHGSGLKIMLGSPRDVFTALKSLLGRALPNPRFVRFLLRG